MPRNLPNQHRLEFRLRVDPEPARILGNVDFEGNRFCRLHVPRGVDQIGCLAEAWIRTGSESSTLPLLSPPWESVAGLFSGVVAPRWTGVQQYLFASPWVRPSTRWADYARTSFIRGIPLLLGALDLVRRVARDFTHRTGLDGLPTPLEAVWRDRMGGREDLAHVLLACLRSLGLPARLVTGYRNPDGCGNVRHVWISVFCPGAGWSALDPQTGTTPEDIPVILNQGRDFTEAGVTDWPAHLVSCDSALVEEVSEPPALAAYGTQAASILWTSEVAHPWQPERLFELQHPPG